MDKKLFRDILLIIGIVALLIVVVVKLDSLLGLAGTLLALVTPFLAGFALAFVLDRPTAFFQRLFDRILHGKHPPVSRGLGIAATYLLGAIILVLVGVYIVPQLTASISTLVGYIGRLQEWINLVTDWLKMDRIDVSQISKFLKDLLENPAGIISQIFPYIYNFTSGIISFGINVILGVATSVYLLADKKRLLIRCRKISYAVFPYARAKRLGERLHLISVTFSRFIDGQVTQALILGVLCFIGMLIFRFEYPLLISVTVALFNLIPYLGAYLAAIPSVFILLMTDNPISALWFLLFLIALQQLSGNLIYPKIVGESVGLPSLWVLVSVVLFGGLFGLGGMLLAVPVASVIYRLLGEYTGKRLRKKVDDVEQEDAEACRDLRAIAEIPPEGGPVDMTDPEPED